MYEVIKNRQVERLKIEKGDNKTNKHSKIIKLNTKKN